MHFGTPMRARMQSAPIKMAAKALLAPLLRKLRQPRDTQKAAPAIARGTEIVQCFRAEFDHLSVISLFFITFGRQNQCNVKIELFRLEDETPSSISTALRSQSIIDETFDARLLNDNAWHEVFVENEVESAGQLYLLKISSTDATEANAVTVLLTKDVRRVSGHVFCETGNTRDSTFGLLANVGYAPPVTASTIPPRLLISPASQCNLNCVHCISRETRRTPTRMSAQIRQHIQRWAHAGMLERIATDYSGDILWSDQRFGGDLDFLFELAVPFHLDTNGTHLDVRTSHRLMASRVTSINVSLDAARDSTFQRIRKGAGSLAAVLRNMDSLRHARTAANRRDIKLTVGFTLMRSNIEELVEAVDLTKRTGFDGVQGRHVEAYTDDMRAESLWWDKQRFNAVRAEAITHAANIGVQLFLPAPFDDGLAQTGHTVCHEPWNSAVILADGRVQACCIPGTEMGNLTIETMEDIWNGPKYRELRRAVNSKAPPTACRKCPIFRKPNNESSYLRPGAHRI